MAEYNEHLDTLQDIRKMMQRSSRFISLSGLSGVAAGVWALAGAYFADRLIRDFLIRPFSYEAFDRLRLNLFLVAITVLALALLSAFYFTWRKASKQNQSLWDHSARMLSISIMIPLVTGGLFILAMVQHNVWAFVAPGCLVFYGLALVSGGRYTLSEIKYLGYLEIALGLVNTQFVGYGLTFWAIGFGVLHLVYGFIMWWKYDRNPELRNRL